MPKPKASELLPRYRATLAKYEDEGDPRADIQRRLIARLELEAAEENKPKTKRKR